MLLQMSWFHFSIWSDKILLCMHITYFSSVQLLSSILADCIFQVLWIESINIDVQVSLQFIIYPSESIFEAQILCGCYSIMINISENEEKVNCDHSLDRLFKCKTREKEIVFLVVRRCVGWFCEWLKRFRYGEP